ncbi:hypothetical protein [Diplocloster modestus]|uniref:Uncharacterized protein n=1 Tax=Diplocloster modestus TaxID=2850322 RepID=A0ABS6KAR9_9FIRM|nr:hypothetical protein [Diplocloster modestus]MBU9727601.1 hypothetical protein [Diplocloster modestus]
MRNSVNDFDYLDRKINKMNLLIICAGIIAVMAIGFVYSYKLHNQDIPTMTVTNNAIVAVQE